MIRLNLIAVIILVFAVTSRIIGGLLLAATAHIAQLIERFL